MIKIAYSNVKKLDLKKAYPFTSPDRQKKISRYRFDKDKKLSCGAYLLLKKLLDEINITDPIFKTKKYGKSYISNYPDIHFNLSHSGKYVACAIADTPIGVDIEYNDCEIDLNIAKHYFFNSEYKRIIEAETPSNEFFKYWVLKESYMKYTGLGFHLSLDSFEIIMENDDIKLKDDKNNIKFNLFDVDNYKLAFASNQCTNKIREYDISELYH